MDEHYLEIASDLEQRHRDAAIAQAANPKTEAHPEFDGLHCVEEDCGDEIPVARLALGKYRCVECQARRERSTR